MGKTTIEWCDVTWNPVTGCTKVSQGCKHCYAERVFPRAYGKDRKFTDVRCHPERLDQPLHWRQPQRVFVNSMSDLFHEAVPVRFIAEVFNAMVSWRLQCRKRDCEHGPDCYADPGHVFQILTKRPERMLDILKPGGLLEQDVSEYWPGDSPLSIAYEGKEPFPNVWLGVSVEDQKTADERIPLLLQTPAAVRFVSYEPALAAVDFQGFPMPDGDHLNDRFRWYDHECDEDSGLDWIIVGGESGPKARPFNIEWAESAIEQCRAAGVPCFVKQLGRRPVWRGQPLRLKDSHGGDWSEWPEDLRVREFPGDASHD